MRHILVATCCVICAAGGSIGEATAQGIPPSLAGLKMVAPEPERPGDRALSCAQITREIGLIMQKRKVQQAAATSRRKLCSSTKVLARQGNEKLQLQQAQTSALAAASVAPGPAAGAIISKVNADTMALERRQQPERQLANAQMMAGMGDMMSAFNDPRLMRLGMLAQERQCAENAPPPTEDPPAETCESTDDVAAPPGAATATATGPADPFAPNIKATPANPDPFARR
jgi:hypothetical protein